MLSKDEEERLLRRALEKGWLSQADLTPEKWEGQQTSSPARFGERLDVLLETGVLSEQALSLLLQEDSAAAARLQAEVGPAVSQVPQWERYEIVSLLGEGGMGTVYKARDLRLQRMVAIKFIRTERPGAVQRFLQEARAQARIEHEHVCKVFEVGEVDGKPYIAMELVNGVPLHRVMGQLRLEEKLCIVRDAAEAVHAAHRLGVVHRDLKPSNILTQRREDGTWRPVVMDFGLAHDAEAGQQLTQSGLVMGTPAYMSPEQARGDTRNVDRRTDVYALGATLFEVLTERLPFEGANHAEILLKTLNQDPPLLRSIRPGLPVDLETIVLKCLQKDPAQRYESARALAEDLRRYLNGDSILGKRSSLFYRIRQKARKNQALVMVALLALVGLSVLGAYGVQARMEVRREQAQATARTALSQELGQSIKEMEWFIRAVQELPLHDVTYAKARMKARILKLAALRHELGDAGDALIQYALGQGYFALKDFDRAHTHLLAAQRKGSDTAELRWTLGRVLGEQYKKKLEEALRTGNVGFVRARKQELGEKYLQPALALLRTSQGVELGSPLMLEGLIALYDQKYDEALRISGEAVRESPWLYEATQLAGDAHFARAIDHLQQGDLERAGKSFELAIGRYKEAAETGRSDAQIYEAIAESYLQLGDIVTNLEMRFEETAPLDQATRYCEKAITIEPDRVACYSKSARAYAGLISAETRLERPLDQYIAKLSQIAQKGLQVDPDDAYIYDSIGSAYHYMASSSSYSDEIKNKYFGLSIENLKLALQKQPDFPVSRTNLGYSLLDQALYTFDLTGTISKAGFDQAIENFKGAYTIDPYYMPAWGNTIAAYRYLIQFLLLTGRDPASQVRAMLEAYQAGLAKGQKSGTFLLSAGESLHYYTSYLLLNQDVSSLAWVREQQRIISDQADKLLPATEPKRELVHLYRAVDDARTFVATNQDPTPALEVGMRAFPVCITDVRIEFECQRLASILALIAADLAQQRGRPFLPHAQQAATHARRALALFPDPVNHEQLAHALLRQAPAQTPGSLSKIIAEGLKVTEEGLKRGRGFAELHALRGRFHLLQLQAAVSPKERLALSQKARDELARAVDKNPLLARAYEPFIAQARALIGARVQK